MFFISSLEDPDLPYHLVKDSVGKRAIDGPYIAHDCARDAPHRLKTGLNLGAKDGVCRTELSPLPSVSVPAPDVWRSNMYFKQSAVLLRPGNFEVPPPL